MVKGKEGLTEDEKKALRGSKFAPLPPSLPSSSSSSSLPRIPHPGGPVATNKAIALAKFLERKLREPGGLDNVKPELVELAVKNAKQTVKASGTCVRGITIRHVTSFDDSEAFVARKSNRAMPKLRVTSPDNGRYEERPVAAGTLNVAQLRHILLLHQGKDDGHDGPLGPKKTAEVFRLDPVQVEKITQFVSMPAEVKSTGT